jgi:glutamate/tyrosine decarboxylase-like PLP-dependent enzyme
MYRIPEKGWDRETVLGTLDTFRQQDLDWRGGRTFAYVYDAGKEAEEVCKAAFVSYMKENALDPTVFPSLLKIENDLVAMAGAHLNAPEDAVGSFTSGGTESIFCAVKAARDYARAERGIERPHMVLPATAHASFHKAGKYLGVDFTVTDVDPNDYRADVAKMAEAIRPETILLVGSATSYGHGVVDPIGAMGELAQAHDLLLHVDGCIGAFLLPYFRKLGDDIPPFDLSVPGVTSISMDFHKYAYAAKGASVLMYRDASLRRYQFFATAGWTGYTQINTVMQSTRGGGPLAAAWATLHFLGEDGFLDLARRIRDATHTLMDGIEAIDGLHLTTRSDLSLIAFETEGFDLFHVIDEMRNRGWYVQPQLSFRHYTPNIHLSVGPGNAPHVDAFLEDLVDAVEAARKLPATDASALLEQLAAASEGGELTPETFEVLLGAAGISGNALPERMATINALLDALPTELSEDLLKRYLNALYVPTA